MKLGILDLDNLLTTGELSRDPYPTLKALRREEPVAFFPKLNRFLVTTCEFGERVLASPDLFGPAVPNHKMLTVMGPNMQHIDGDTHRKRRLASGQGLKPTTIQNYWSPLLQDLASRRLDTFLERGEGELLSLYVLEMTGEMLGRVLGLSEVEPMTIHRWSAHLIEALETDEPEMLRAGLAASAEIDAALEDAIERRRSAPDESMISHLLATGEGKSVADIASDVKLTIAGGFNEPQNSITTTLVGLAQNVDQWRLAKSDPALLIKAFEESVRWVAPIGLTGRRSLRDQTLGGKDIPQGTLMYVSLSSLNRDEATFEAPDRFDLRPTRRPHFAFGSGGHRCLGAAMARHFGARIILPALINRICEIELTSDPQYAGFSFRGPTRIEARWTPA